MPVVSESPSQPSSVCRARRSLRARLLWVDLLPVLLIGASGVLGWLACCNVQSVSALAKDARLLPWLAAYLGVAIGLLLLAWYFRWRLLTERLFRFSDAVRYVRETGDKELRVVVGAMDEVGELEQGFNDLMATLGTHARELAEAEAFKRAFWDSSGMGVATLDAEGVMRLANPVAQTLLGLAKGDLTRRAVRLEEFIRPLDVSAGYENLPEIMQQLTMAGAGARSVRVEVVLSRLGAAPMPVQLLINGLWASPERLIGYVVFFANTRG